MDTAPIALKLRGRTRYDALRAEVSRAIDDADPIGLLATGCPADEYSPEIGTIVPRVSTASDPGEVTCPVYGYCYVQAKLLTCNFAMTAFGAADLRSLFPSLLCSIRRRS